MAVESILIAQIFAVAVVVAFYLCLALFLNERYYFLRLVAFGFAIFTLLLIPTFVIDKADNCQAVLSNTSLMNGAIIGSTTLENTTIYSYTQFCINSTKVTDITFYKTYMWWLRIVSFMVLVSGFYHLAIFMYNVGNKKKIV